MIFLFAVSVWSNTLSSFATPQPSAWKKNKLRIIYHRQPPWQPNRRKKNRKINQLEISMAFTHRKNRVDDQCWMIDVVLYFFSGKCPLHFGPFTLPPTVSPSHTTCMETEIMLIRFRFGSARWCTTLISLHAFLSTVEVRDKKCYKFIVLSGIFRYSQPHVYKWIYNYNRPVPVMS